MAISLFDVLGDDAPFINIVDVGAMGLGTPVEYARLLRPGRHRVLGFEPAREECEKLIARHQPGHTYLPYFIGSGKESTFHECNLPMTSSLLAPNTRLLREFQNLAELVTPVAEHRVQTHQLDDIAEARPCDLFKIDVQGAELEVFKCAEKVLASACVIHTEVEFVPLYSGQPLFADVDAFLRARGFLFHTFHGLSGRCFKPLMINGEINLPLRQYLWSDAVYVRDFTRFDELAPDTLLKLAVIVQELYESSDLAARALQHHDAKRGGNLWKRWLSALLGSNDIPEPPPL